MSDNETQLEKKIAYYEETVADSLVELKRAYMAINEILDNYERNYTPEARKAYEYANTVHPDEVCDEESRWAWEYMCGYEKIMWLVNVARDYCYLAIKNCEEAYKGGAINE